MVRVSGDALLFDQASIAVAVMPRVKAMRSFFFDKKITNEDYLARYREAFKGSNPNDTEATALQKIAADRKFLLDPNRVTPKMITRTIGAMRYDVVEFDETDDQFRLEVVDKKTGEKSVYAIDA